MKILDRLKVERETLDARLAVLRAAKLFVDMVKDLIDEDEVERRLAGILTLDGFIPPVVRYAGPPVTFSRPQVPGALFPAYEGFDAVDTDLGGDPESEDIAELEEMVAVPTTQQSPPGGETGGPSGAGMAAEPTATAETSSLVTVAGHQSAPQPDAPPQPAAGLKVTDLPTVREKPLTDDEIAEVLERDARGQGCGTIAAAIGRNPQGFYHTVKSLRQAEEERAGNTETEGAEPEAEDPKADDPEEAAPISERAAVSGFIVEPPAGAPLKVKALYGFLNALGYPAPWTPARDAILATMLASGEELVNTVTALKLDRTHVKARWEALLPVRGIDEQKRLVEALQHRNEIWDARTKGVVAAAE
ncbi:MAG: hypothetical protein KDK11_14780 [Maritimibacter sp.]|nr:hypothetical protein [Maritimibacter sp.]